MTDWREMSAGRELDRFIAERLGYTGFVEHEWNSATRDFDDLCYTTQREYDGQDIYLEVDRYSTDLNTILYMPLPEGAHLKLDIYPHVTTARIVLPSGMEHANSDALYQGAPTPALAAWRVWLAWKEQQENVA